MKHRLPNTYAAPLLAVSLLIIGGNNAEGRIGILSYFAHNSFEETSALVINVAQSSVQLADMNSFAATPQIAGQGGPENTIDPGFVQDNSIIAFTPPQEDYASELGLQRNTVVEYTIQDGDLLSFIASDYGVSVNSIIWANNLKSADNLTPGQIIRIPPVSGVIHKVLSGDTLESVARRYGVESDKILQFNGLPMDGKLALGEEIIIPDGKKSGSSGTSTTASPTKRFTYLPDMGGYFMIPTTGFNWGRIHGRNGVDIANSCGTPIMAAADGNVTTADNIGWNGGFGNYIKILHPNSTETLYAHAKKLLVKAGESVTRGQQIALMGTTGRSTGCHLHFEVHGAKNPLAKY